jgi:hypothetical protein
VYRSYSYGYGSYCAPRYYSSHHYGRCR